jgi:hypothetical protein
VYSPEALRTRIEEALIDWNLCFNARGESTNRACKSGTPAFMAPVLLDDDDQITRRTLGHDMESFFAVIIWMATLDPDDEAGFLAKPLALEMLGRNTPRAMVHAKENWFGRTKAFKKSITNHFALPYREDVGFLRCLFKLREILYPSDELDLDALLYDGDSKVTEEVDPMKEDQFRQCMREIDDYLQETKGCSEMHWIDSTALERHTPEDLMQEGNGVNQLGTGDLM